MTRGITDRSISSRQLVLWVLLLLLVLFTRFYHLDQRPFHHDESLYAQKIWEYHQGEGYKFDPMTLGPFIFHAHQIPLFILGDTEFAMRALPALTGFILILTLFFSRKIWGNTTALLAAAMFTVNPVFMYYQRYVRQDMYFSLFCLGAVIALNRWLKTHTNKHFFLAATALSLAASTKFEAYWFFLILAVFPLLTGFKSIKTHLEHVKIKSLIVAGMIYLGITVTLYTTFFTNIDAIQGMVYEWYQYWVQQENVSRIFYPASHYNHLLLAYAILPMTICIIGTITQIIQLLRKRPGGPKHLFLKGFLLWWSILTCLFYAFMVRQKVPWFLVNMLVPAILLAAIYLSEFYQSRGSFKTKVWITVLLAPLILYEAHTSIMACYRTNGDPSELINYVHTSPQIPKLLDELENVAESTGSGKQLPILVTGHATWPLNYYLRNWTEVSYSMNVDPNKHMIVICNWKDRDRFESQLSSSHTMRKACLREWWLPKFSDLRHAGIWKSIWDWIIYREKFLEDELWGCQKICIFIQYGLTTPKELHR